MRMMWTVFFLIASYLEAPGVFPPWVPDLGLTGLLVGPLTGSLFPWVALIGGLLRGGWMGWMTFPLIHVAYALVEPSLRSRLNFEVGGVRWIWYGVWAVLIGVLLHDPWPRALAAGLLAGVLSFWVFPERA